MTKAKEKLLRAEKPLSPVPLLTHRATKVMTLLPEHSWCHWWPGWPSHTGGWHHHTISAIQEIVPCYRAKTLENQALLSLRNQGERYQRTIPGASFTRELGSKWNHRQKDQNGEQGVVNGAGQRVENAPDVKRIGFQKRQLNTHEQSFVINEQSPDWQKLEPCI